jgi:N-carbamoylputrescine amidase
VEGAKEYFGLSAVYGPSGEILATAPDDADGLALAEVDLAQVDEIRRRRPFLRDRRPELYGRVSAAQTAPTTELS